MPFVVFVVHAISATLSASRKSKAASSYVVRAGQVLWRLAQNKIFLNRMSYLQAPHHFFFFFSHVLCFFKMRLCAFR